MFAKSLAVAAVVAVSALAATSAQAGPNLVSNGGFASSTYTVSTQFGTNATVATQQGVNGWTGNNGYDIWFANAATSSTENTIGQYTSTGKEELWGPVATSPGGGSFIALDGDQVNGIQGAISQTIAGLTAGTQYQLSFDWAGAQMQSRGGPTTDQVMASLGGQSFSTAVINNASQSSTSWMTQTFVFTATGTSELLNFLSIGTPGGLPPMALLDDVSLVQVPEPMSLALLGAGLVGLGVVRRARRKS